MRRSIFALMFVFVAVTAFSAFAAPQSAAPQAAWLTMTPSPRPLQAGTATPFPVTPVLIEPTPTLEEGTRFENGYSVLKVGEWRVTLTVCADNLVPGTVVYAIAFRDALETVGSDAPIPAAQWVYEQVALETNLFSLTSPDGRVYTDRCIVFDGYERDPLDPDREMEGMDVSNRTYPGITYYTQATLDPVIGLSFYTEPYTAWDRGGCAAATNELGLCDSGIAPFFFRAGFNDTGA